MDGADVFFIIRKGLSGGTADDLDGEPTVRLTPEFSQIRFVVADGVTTIWQLNYGTDADDPAHGIKRPRDFNLLTNAKVWKGVLTGGGGIGGSIADKQVAFGNGTAIAGSDDFKWDDNAKALKFSYNGNPAGRGDIRAANVFSMYSRNGANNDDVKLLSFGGTNLVVGGNGVLSLKIGDPDGALVGISMNLNGSEFSIVNQTDGGHVEFDLGGGIGSWLAVGGGPLVLYPQATPPSLTEGMIWSDITDHVLYWYDGTNTREIVATLDDVLSLTPRTQPGSPSRGWIYSSSVDGHLYYYNGTAWKQLD